MFWGYLRKMLRIKKGDTFIFEDIIYVLVYLFASALLVFILYFVYGQIGTPINSALSGAVSDGNATFNYTLQDSQTTGGIKFINTLFPLLLIGLILMVIVSAMFLDSHPIFFFVSLIILAVVIFLGLIFSNVYHQITDDEAFESTNDELPITYMFMKYLPIIILVVMVIGIIIAFSKSGGGGAGL